MVVNTCAFVDERPPGVDRHDPRPLAEARADGRPARRDRVHGRAVRRRAGLGAARGRPRRRRSAELGDRAAGADRARIPVAAAQLPDFDLLNLPAAGVDAPWAYVKVAEGCDRACGFCAIPSFRGPQRSARSTSILAEVDALGVREIVLVAQDLAAFGRDQGVGERSIVPLVEAVAERVDRVRLLYLYPSDLTDGLIDAMCATGVPVLRPVAPARVAPADAADAPLG